MQIQRSRMQILERCGHDCAAYRAVADELDRVLNNYLQYYNEERALLAQRQAMGG